MKIILRSHGMKQNPVTEAGVVLGYEFPRADLYLDCRSIADPSHAGLSGSTPEGEVYIADHSAAALNFLYGQVVEAINPTILEARWGKDWKEKDVNVLCLCAHGMNRSVATKKVLGKWLVDEGFQVEII